MCVNAEKSLADTDERRCQGCEELERKARVAVSSLTEGERERLSEILSKVV